MCIENRGNKQFIAIFCGLNSCFWRISATIFRIIQVYANNIVFILKIRLCSYKIAINYLLSPFFYAIFSSLWDHFSFFVLLFCFPNKRIDLLNIHNRSKTLAFKNLNHLLYKYYPKLVKTFKKHSNKFDIRQFLVLLSDCITNVKNLLSIDRLVKNVNFLQTGTGKNPITLLYSETKKKVKFV